MTQDPYIDAVYTVSAGKFRRYHGEGLRQFLDLHTLAKNTADFFRTAMGIGQARRLLRTIRPDLVFIKGGFVGVPIGLAAAWLHIPYITHDSDAIPGLANRIIGRWSVAHAVAMPKDLYDYPAAKTYTVGVPISKEYQPVSQQLQQRYRRELGLAQDAPMVFVTGGGLGAQRLNDAVASIAPKLLARYPRLVLMHLTGKNHEVNVLQAYAGTLSPTKRKQVLVKGFVDDLYRYSGAADVIITRAGATAIAEFAAQGKACIMVPNPQLTGGQQLKNVQPLATAHAVKLINESDLKIGWANALEESVIELLDYPEIRQELSKKIAQFSHPKANIEITELLLRTLSNTEITGKTYA